MRLDLFSSQHHTTSHLHLINHQSQKAALFITISRSFPEMSVNYRVLVIPDLELDSSRSHTPWVSRI